MKNCSPIQKTRYQIGINKGFHFCLKIHYFRQIIYKKSIIVQMSKTHYGEKVSQYLFTYIFIYLVSKVPQLCNNSWWHTIFKTFQNKIANTTSSSGPEMEMQSHLGWQNIWDNKVQLSLAMGLSTTELSLFFPIQTSLGTWSWKKSFGWSKVEICSWILLVPTWKMTTPNLLM